MVAQKAPVLQVWLWLIPAPVVMVASLSVSASTIGRDREGRACALLRIVWPTGSSRRPARRPLLASSSKARLKPLLKGLVACRMFPFLPASSGFVILGKIVDAYGLRGAVKVLPFADDPLELVKVAELVAGKRRSPPEVWQQVRLLNGAQDAW